MKNVKKFMISPETSVREAIEFVDITGKKVALIVDENDTLLGIFTDGDMRKYILRNGDLKRPVSEAMNTSPKTFFEEEDIDYIMNESKMIVYPVVNKNNILVDVHFWNDDENEDIVDDILASIPVVIMAGGKGTRLYPYTKILPKPLIPIGDVTISERIINSFVKHGGKEFHFILNYKSNMIKAYFSDLKKNYDINYVDEDKFLGTGGGLSLLKGLISDTFFVSNCDIIVNANFSSIYKYHKEEGNLITFVCAMKNMTIPYGIINLNEEGSIKELVEKPSYSFLTNTGLYVIEASVLNELTEDEFIHLPDIASRYIEQGRKVGVYPISEKSWHDMGEFSEMESMMKNLGIE